MAMALWRPVITSLETPCGKSGRLGRGSQGLGLPSRMALLGKRRLRVLSTASMDSEIGPGVEAPWGSLPVAGIQAGWGSASRFPRLGLGLAGLGQRAGEGLSTAVHRRVGDQGLRQSAGAWLGVPSFCTVRLL